MISAMMGSQRVPALENFLAKVAREGGQPEEKYDASKFVSLYINRFHLDERWLSAWFFAAVLSLELKKSVLVEFHSDK